ncbi:transcription initiation factor TFIID subunit 9B-like [Actinia tenebrosa]|uniref:Transcription initiation factor TFIID subunit 9B-like n=1 Tax=Actinia tenebrosa TaxID=6105 RepID=A0A6P8HCH6_ACTTE|nr:transcription initiation factor TFIID subunit 9B-like [Actinia tenebrosa]
MAASQADGNTAASTNESSKPAAKSTPKDALVMGAILREMGISDYEPRVVNQMLEFTYRYVTMVLDDAKAYSSHAGKKDIDTDDVQLAIQSRLDHSYTSPPPRDFLIEIARQKNRIPLPQFQPKSGLRLPPDRYCLTGKNYKVRAQKKPPMRPSPAISRTNSISSSSTSSIVKPSTVVQVVRPQSSAVPISTTAARSIASTPQLLVTNISTSSSLQSPQVKPEPSITTAARPTPTGSVPTSIKVIKSEAAVPALIKSSTSTPTTIKISTPTTTKPGNQSGTNPASIMTVSALPSMDETVASAQQPLITPQKRKHDDADDDYDV